MLEAELSQPDGKAQAVEGLVTARRPPTVKLLVLPLVGNLALIKVLGVLSVGELPSAGPLGKEPLGKKIRLGEKLCSLLFSPCHPLWRPLYLQEG